MFRIERFLVAGLMCSMFALSAWGDASAFSVTASPNPSYYGQPVVVSGCLYNIGGAAGDTITFAVDGVQQGVVPFNVTQYPNCAQITVTGLGAGLHSATGMYNGSLAFFNSQPRSVTMVVDPPAADAQFVQQGLELVGRGAWTYGAAQGVSVALSADGNTALVGGPTDNNGTGAVWVFTRSEGVWNQEGDKLVGTGTTEALQGWSAALSEDGNTALVGGPADNSEMGAAWVFTRSGGVWSQEGDKLSGAGAMPDSTGAERPRQGTSVALSADGNTALVGGPYDGTQVGAFWVFTRSGSAWTQQGGKLVATDGGQNSGLGSSVALSADGNTAAVGASDGVRIFIQSNGAWSQQGANLPTGRVLSVAVSADGNTALVLSGTGTPGTVLVFQRSGSGWSQQGTGYAVEGTSMASSANGNTILINDPWSGHVIARMYTRSGNSWVQRGTRLMGSYVPLPPPPISVGFANIPFGAVALSADATTGLLGEGGDDSANIGGAWVFVGSNPTTTTLTASPNPALDGQRVVLSARVTAGATGTVTFTIDGVLLPQIALNGNIAQMATALSAGSHRITAAYGGDSNYQASTSDVLVEMVKPKATVRRPSQNPSPPRAVQQAEAQ